MTTDASFFGLNRPEYVPSRELFISELAWSLTPGKSPRKVDPDYGPAGITYADRGTRKKAGIASTRPDGDDPRLSSVSAVLKERLRLKSKEEADTATSILLDELEAPASERATRVLATPLTIEAALLQDRRGVTGKNNPANVSLILEQMYTLGGGSGSVADMWAGATRGAEPSGLPAWAGEAIAEIVPAGFRESARQLANGLGSPEPGDLRQPAWLSSCQSTPFRWFAETWDHLCTRGWIDRMPRRRWTDWSACVARTAIATGYMFEMHLARRMTAALVSQEDPEIAVRSAVDDSDRIFAWDDRLGRVTADVGPTMNRLAAAGTNCLLLLADLAEPDNGGNRMQPPSEFDDDANGLSEWLAQAREAIAGNVSEVRKQVSNALEGKRSGGANNTWETMRYSLLGRSGSGTDDLYALLRGAGKYTWVEPGQEWLVTIASLQAPGPGKLSRLTELDRALSAIGIEASQQTLVARLEGYGLARSSHDADDALEILAGF